MDFEVQYNNGLKGWGFSFRRSQLFRYQKYIDLIKKNLLGDGVVLEIGCCDGWFTAHYLNTLFNDIIGIDLSDKAIDVANTAYPSLEFRVDSLPELSSVNEQIHLITLLECIYYLPWQMQQSSIRRIYELCENDGYLLISVHIGKEPYYTKAKVRKLIAGRFRVVAEDDICIKQYFSVVESFLWNILVSVQTEFWETARVPKSRKEKLKSILFNNFIARNVYNHFISIFLKAVLFCMPICLIDWVGRRINYGKNLSTYIVLCKKIGEVNENTKNT